MSRAPVEATRRRRLLVTSALAVAALVAGLVTVVLARRPDPPTAAPADVRAAAGFAVDVTTTDRAARARAIGRWVVPHRVGDFLAAFDDAHADPQRPGQRVVAVARGYKVAERRDASAVVLVWTEVTSTGTVTATTWDVSAFGVVDRAGRWWVYSYEGTKHDVPPDDPRLQGFRRLERRPDVGAARVVQSSPSRLAMAPAWKRLSTPSTS